MFRWIAERFKRDSREPIRIDAVQADEFGMHSKRSSGEALHLLWRDVVLVRGYKRDLLTTDSVVIEFELPNAVVIRSWEEDPAFREVVAAAERYLTGFPPYKVWYAVVVMPPFKTRFHTLWGQPTDEAPALP
ncbi:MAG: hypothetical protein ACF8Q5_00035 [Phycisphaerales bacterium JB040]